MKGLENGSGDKDDIFHLEETDKELPSAWKSGSLKYGELKPLSEGGTAKLYLARDKNLRRTVAYKTLHDDLRDDEIEARRFLRKPASPPTSSTRAPSPFTNSAVTGKATSSSP